MDRQKWNVRIAFVCLLGFALFGWGPIEGPGNACAAPGEFGYSYRAGDEGGAATFRVAADGGRLESHRSLFRLADAKKAKKVRFTADGAHAALTVARAQTPNLFVCAVAGGEPVAVSLPGEPDEIRAVGHRMVASCEGGTIALVDIPSGRLEKAWNARAELTPPASAAEDIFVTDDGAHAVISYESDNRLVILALPALTLVADLRLPLDRPEVQMSDDWKRSGPQPEIVLVSGVANALMASLDQFGAVGIMDSRAALHGKLENVAYLSTARDGAWGESYPDRACLAEIKGRGYALVTNAGPGGGAVLVDLAARKVVRRWDVPHGLEKPVYLPHARCAVAAPAGKLKQRGAGRSYIPGDSLYVFELGGGSLAEAPVRAIPMVRRAYYVAALNPSASDLVVVAAGVGNPDTLLVVDVAGGRIVSETPALGAIQRLESVDRVR